jgi:hypothetical protein
MLTAYRIAYGLILAAFLGNMVMRISDQPPASTSLLFAIAGLLLLAIFGLVVRFSRIQPTVFWLLVLGWEVLFVWSAWFSPAAPFVFHEAHTLDAGAAARESTIHYVKSGALFGLLFAWFLSLPLARTWKGRADGTA